MYNIFQFMATQATPNIPIPNRFDSAQNKMNNISKAAASKARSNNNKNKDILETGKQNEEIRWGERIT